MKQFDDNLDKLYEEKYSAKKYAFQEKYWEQANVLIQQRKAAKRKRIFFLSLTSIAAVLSVVLLLDTADQNLTNQYKERTFNPNDFSENLSSNEEISIVESKTNSTSEQKTVSKTATTIDKEKTEFNENHSIKALQKNQETFIQASQPQKASIGSYSTNKSLEQNTKTLNTERIAQNQSTNKSESPTLNALSSNSTINRTDYIKENTTNKTATTKEKKLSIFPLYPTTLEQQPNGFSLANNHLSKNSQTRVQEKRVNLPINLGYSNGELLNKSIEFPKTSHFPITLYASGGAYSAKPYENLSSHNVENASSLNLAIDLEYLIGKRWGIQSGLHFNQFSEDIETRFLNLEDVSFTKQIDNSYFTFDTTYHTNSSGDVYWPDEDTTYNVGGKPGIDVDSNYIMDITYVKVEKYDTIDLRQKSTIKVEYYEVPVLLTYHITKGRIGLQLMSGISFGFYKTSSGKYISVENNAALLDADNTSLFNSMHTNFIAGFAATYAINENYQFMIRPQYKANLNSIYSNTSAMKRRYQSTGINIGLAYKF